MPSFITSGKSILRAWPVLLGGLALAIFALGLPLTAAEKAAMAPKSPNKSATKAVHHSSVHVSHATKFGHSHGITSSAKGHHVRTHMTMKGVRSTTAGLAHSSREGVTGVGTIAASHRYADAEVAERHELEQLHEWHRRHQYGWHGYGWWHRHHWWVTDVQTLVGSTVDIPAVPEATIGETPTVAGGGTLPAGQVKIVNRKTGTALWRGAIFRIEHSGEHVKIAAIKSGNYLALREPVKRADGTVAASGAARTHLAEAQDPQSPTTLWKAEPAGEGFWRIVNRETGKVLEDRGSEGVVVQSALREGAPEQEWRVESASD